MTRVRQTAATAAVAVGLLGTLLASPALAFWSAGSVAGGNGESSAATVDEGATPTAVAAGTTVTVSWDASTLSTGHAVAGYIIERYDPTTLTPQTILTACDGTVSATSCDESAVPPGQWVYSVSPVIGAHWIGPESLMSNRVTVESTPPVNALSASTVQGNTFMDGDTIFYRGAAEGSFVLTNALTDSDSGPASSTTAALAGDSSGWTHVPSTVSSPPGGPYVSNPFTWTTGSVSGPTEEVTGRDEAGNSAVTTISLADDSTAPTPGTISYPDGYQPDQFVEITFTTGIDTGSGIATRQLQRSATALTNGVCGTFSSFSNVGPESPASPFVDSHVTDGSCYKYRYVVTDQVSNKDVATNAHVARVDAGAGGPTLGGAGSFSVLGGTGVANTGATSVSGDLGVSPSNSVAGFPPGIVAGTIHAGDAAAAQAQSDLTLAYNDAAGRTPSGNFSGDLNGQTFDAGIYHTDAALALTGTMTLDGEGDPNSIFIFQVNAALNTAAASHVNLINGAKASHVFWQVNGAAGTGASSSFSGTILAAGAITLGADSQLVGRALSYGTVTLATNTIRFTNALPPVVTIDGGATAVTKDTTRTITGTASATAGTTVTVKVAGQTLTTTIQNDSSWTVTTSALTAGAHVVTASARDSAGNAGSATQTLTVQINPDPVALGGAGSFSVLGGTGVANTGATSVSGDLGVSPSNSVAGFPPGIVAGTIHAGDAAAAQAQSDLTLAYNDAAGRTPSGNFSGDLNGQTFDAGIYHTDAALALTGTMTLDGEGDPNSIFIFQVNAALNTAAASHVNLINGAKASHVFWQVNGAAGTGASSSFSGTILAAGAITLGADSQLVGRALSYGTVTLATNTITTP